MVDSIGLIMTRTTIRVNLLTRRTTMIRGTLITCTKWSRRAPQQTRGRLSITIITTGRRPQRNITRPVLLVRSIFVARTANGSNASKKSLPTTRTWICLLGCSVRTIPRMVPFGSDTITRRPGSRHRPNRHWSSGIRRVS
uniref:Uncharacterized protein n=1 Tax=Cacopsylla melanoneura TaxID=428564 RepID=A0A8D8SS00_9HEMI